MLIKNNGEKPDLLTRIMNFLFGKFFKIFNRSFDWVSEKYGKAVHGIVRRFGACNLYVRDSPWTNGVSFLNNAVRIHSQAG